MAIKVKIEAICQNPECNRPFRKFKSTDKYCSGACYFVTNPTKNKPRVEINKKSEKRKKEDKDYTVLRRDFLSHPDNRICPVTGQRTTEIHHKKGRKGYADEWARLNKISLYIDVRFFLAVSRDGHQQIEERPEWAKEMGFSLNRI